MKRNVALLAGIAALGITAWVGDSAHGQNVLQTNATVAAPAASLRTRVALINLPHIIKSYEKYQNFEREWQDTYKNFDTNLESKRKLMLQWQGEAQKNQADTVTRDGFERKIRDLQREMQDLGEEAKKQLSKKRDDQAVIIYREIEEAVQVYARSKDIELVMHFNDAIVPADITNPMNIQRKMQIGALFPVYSAPGMDITNDVVTMLNTRYRKMMGVSAAPAQPQR